jgi:peptidoglycan/LPS O-acetylase OafA/YrhL
MLTYRPEIDGLRALAVLSVVLFHLDFGILPGGFIGVDVFFVISGFLITSIILQEQTAGHFSFAGFYERRIRRILPAAFVVIAATLLAGFFVLLPGDYVSLAASSLSAALYVSNFYFWKQDGYFQTAAHEQPLLHTWSLSVEEQFYILFPIFIILALRFFGRDGAFWLLLVCALGSLALSEWIVARDQNLAFYMLPTRAWQLGMGSLLAFQKLPRLRFAGLSQAAGFIGLGLIGWSLASYNAQTIFPGLAALAPTLGAAAVIYGTAQTGVISRFLSLRPLVLIGKISYSLYLWHWPLIAFALYRFGEMPGIAGKIAIVLASVLLAFITWNWVENPLRNRAFLPGYRVFAMLGLCTVLCAGVALTIMQAKGFPGRFDRAVITAEQAAEDYNPLRDMCNDAPIINHPENLAGCTIGDQTKMQVSALLWGDSVADSFAPGIDKAFSDMGIKAIQSTKNSCAPLLKAYLTRASAEAAQACQNYNHAVIEYLQKHPEIQTIILAASWPDVAAHISYEAYDRAAVSAEARMAALEMTHNETIKTLRSMNRKILVISAVPHFTHNPPACLARQKLFDDPESFACLPTMRKDFDEGAKPVIGLHERLRKEGVTVFFPHQSLCDEGACHAVQGMDILYYDPGHLSVTGARFLASGLKKALQETIRQGYTRDQ